MPVVPTNGYKSPQVGCDSNCGHYWCGVGQVATGYFINAPYNAVMGTVEAAMDPIGTLQELGHAIRHPIQTTKAIINDAYDKAQTLEGQGELIGDFAFNRLNLGGRLTSKVTTSVTQAVNKLDTHFNAAPAGNMVKRAGEDNHNTNYQSRGRHTPNNDAEAAAKQKVIDNPTIGRELKNITMKDPNFPAWDGYRKFEYKEGNINIHYVRNIYHNDPPKALDVKFKNP